MNIPFTPLVDSLPASTPFVGPETLERQRGALFNARVGANESAFGISPLAADALHAAIDASHGASWYADPESFELRQALAQKHGVDMSEICVDGGIDTLLGVTVRMLVSAGDAVVTSLGAYPTFNYHVAGFGGQLQAVPYVDNHEDPESLLRAADEHSAKLIYIANPDNPMGTSHSAEKMQQMIDAIPAGRMLLLDEAYIDFTTEDLAPALATDNPRVMRFRTFSKAYGMAGMRVGYVIAHRDIITGLNKVRNHFQINRLSQLAATISLSDHAFLAQVQQQVAQARQRVYDLATDLNLPYLPSSTNFVAVDLTTPERARGLLQQLNEHGIFMRMPGAAPLDRYIRVGLGTPTEHQCVADTLRQLIQTSS